MTASESRRSGGGSARAVSRGVRVWRGLGAAGVAVFVAAFSHVMGGGATPGGVGLVLTLAFAAMVCVALAGRRLSIVRLSLSVGLSQVAMHLLFAVGAPIGGAAGSAGSAGMGGAAGSGAAAGLSGAAGSGASASLSGIGMLGGAGAGAGGMSGMGGAGGMPGMGGAGTGTGTGMGMGGMPHGSDLIALLLSGGATFDSSAMTGGATHGAAGVGTTHLVSSAMTGGMSAADDAFMWAAHLVAIVVTVWALRRGAQSVARVIESARMLVLRLVRAARVELTAPRTHGVTVAVARDPGHPADLAVLIGRLRHRGPPVWQFSLS